MKNKNTRQAIAHQFDAVVPSVGGRLYAERITDLLGTVEAFLGADGFKPDIKNIKIFIKMAGLSIFTAQPILVQTAGTFTDTVDINDYNLDAVLDAAVNDVFGYQPLSQPKIGKLVPAGDIALYGLYFTIQMPQHLIQIINKSVETERLQEFYIGLIGSASGTDSYSYDCYMEVEYVASRKTIINR